MRFFDIDFEKRQQTQINIDIIGRKHCFFSKRFKPLERNYFLIFSVITISPKISLALQNYIKSSKALFLKQNSLIFGIGI